jgi:hypothetical protein
MLAIAIILFANIPIMSQKLYANMQAYMEMAKLNLIECIVIAAGC